MPNARDVILKHIDAFNGRDSDADPWAADAEFTAPGAKVSGRDNVIGFIAVFQEAFPDLRLEIEQLLTDGSAAAAEGIMTGTHDGVFHTPRRCRADRTSHCAPVGGGLRHRGRRAEVRAPVLRPDGLPRPTRPPPRLVPEILRLSERALA